ncbi:MAG TPA: serine/threonine-protein kinase [Gemmatimonadales bacterium]|jgi:serine/threonine-protein kinase|nr:serine/threonine-protein kinase [Gemmatimonadales bacterium]
MVSQPKPVTSGTPGPYDDLFVAFQTALAGRYSLEREIGRGGMGIVYLAREVRLDRPVALKLFPPELAAVASLRERFLREARTAARLSHPHIVQIYTVDEVDRFVFFAMAYVDGETLGARIRNRGPMPPSEAARMLREVAWALGYAHEQGVVHRDVKPDNILLEAATGRALVADFGIAGLQQDAATQQTGEVVGTPEFMSPEQAGGARVDAQSDLYALGAVAFYALSGRVPFAGATSAEVLAKHLTQPAPPIAEHAPAVPRRIARIVDACLCKDPAERPAGAAQLAEQLAATLEHRKELPVALRAFVKHDARIDGPGVLLIPPALVIVSINVANFFLALEPGFATFFSGLVLVPAGILAGRARRLLKAGFEHSDLAVAFKTEIERGREERAFSVSPRPSILERITGILSGVGFGSSLLLLFVTGRFDVSAALFALSSVPGLGYVALLQRRRDIDIEFWGNLWTGPIGRLLFRIARAVLPKRAIPQAMTHRPTELAIAMAAEQLFAELPKTTRKHLGDLPAVVHRLEADAQRMRTRLEELQEVVADGPVRRGVDSTDRVARALRDERDTVQKQLADVVAALENIRLGLLRLRSGSGSVQSLTTDLGAARAVGEAVDLLLEGQSIVEAELRRPALPSLPAAPTPTQPHEDPA